MALVAIECAADMPGGPVMRKAALRIARRHDAADTAAPDAVGPDAIGPDAIGRDCTGRDLIGLSDARPLDASVVLASSEQALIEATRRGDPSAFEALLGRHLSRALAVAYRLLGQREDAEDVVQDAFLAALVKIDTFEAGRPFAPWLLRIVANRAINLRKSRTLRQTDAIPPDVRSREASPFEEAVRHELRDRLQRALTALPAPQRWVVELFELDGFTGPEIAQMLDMAEGTVRWHLHEARRALRSALSSPQTRVP
jgi:RNA polymerase sigma-70 factor (ECF subfamily)